MVSHRLGIFVVEKNGNDIMLIFDLQFEEIYLTSTRKMQMNYPTLTLTFFSNIHTCSMQNVTHVSMSKRSQLRGSLFIVHCHASK